MNSLDPRSYYPTPHDQHKTMNEKEAEVAESIVASRKSWKTVKGRAEAVWPPDLEKALVTALLQYRPLDSRYAKALGRFPKRNRYISDFIFEQTGVRRSPKQVGSRLQQLKDVACGKKLLAHVSNWTNHSEDYHDSNVSSPSSEVDQSTSRHPSGGSSSRQSDLRTALRTFENAKYIDVYVPARSQALIASTPSTIEATDPEFDRPFVRFGGTLPVPASLFVLQTSLISPAGSANRPFVFFMSKEPIAARSISRLWFTPAPTYQQLSPVSPTDMTFHGARAQKTCLKEFSAPLVATHTPPPGSVSEVKSGDTQLFAFGNTVRPPAIYPHEHRNLQAKVEPATGCEWLDLDQMPSENDEHSNFVYAARILDDETWMQVLRNQANTVGRYTITQELVCEIDTDANGTGPKRGEIFLSVTYQFASSNTSNMSPLAIAGDNPALASYSPTGHLRLGTGFPIGHLYGSRPSPSPSSPLTPVSPISPTLSPSHSHSIASPLAHAHASMPIMMSLPSPTLTSAGASGSMSTYRTTGRVDATLQDNSAFLDQVYGTSGSVTSVDCPMYHVPQSTYVPMSAMSRNMPSNSYYFTTSAPFAT